MKRQTMLQVPESDEGRPTDMSAEAALYQEISELGEWLAAQGPGLRGDPADAEEGSRDQLYWRYGYLLGLNRALAMLTNRGATVH